MASDSPHRVKLILGLPHLSQGPLLAQARKLEAHILVSANAFARYRVTTSPGPRNTSRHTRVAEFAGWKTSTLPNASGMEVWLDSAGFVAQRHYRGYPWTISDYLDLAAHPIFKRFASMDLCVEPEIAATTDAVQNRIAGTIRLNRECSAEARRRGISNRMIPVIQGWTIADYAYCIENMPEITTYSLVGVGSMCRRPLQGENGVTAIISALDQLLPQHVKLHLFGLKSQAAEALRNHPRVYSIDSQAYGTRARFAAIEQSISKTDQFVAAIMSTWHKRQQARLTKPNFAFQSTLSLQVEQPSAKSPFEAAISRAAGEFRQLVIDGELEHNDFNPQWVYERAGEILNPD